MRLRGRTSGFTLVEVLVALALVSIALLGSASLLWQERAVRARLDRQALAVSALEATVEALRSGALPLRSARHPPPWPLPGSSAIEQLVVVVEVESASIPDLYRLTIEAVYLYSGRVESRRLETLHWRTD